MGQFGTKAYTLGFDPDAGYADAANVTPNDSTDLPIKPTMALFIGGAGNLRVITAGGTTLTLTGVTAGTVIKLMVNRVIATLTTCTNIVALY